MTACFSSQTSANRSSFNWSLNCIVATVIVLLAMGFALRGRITPADLADIDPRLMGPDVLGERMVVPPSIPDWVFMDCQSQKNSDIQSNDESSLINRVRQSICRS